MTIKTVPFFRPSIGDAEIAEVTECLRSGWLTTGPRAAAFERAFARAIGGDVTAIAVNSATAALHLGLEAMGIGPGDEVIVPTLTFTATAEVIRYLGAKPILVDTDPATLCASPGSVEAAITSRTKAIMPVHFAGRPCDMAALRRIADGSGLRILDDAAHAFPASTSGMPIGNCGADATAFSFYANKTITTGEGGMLVTRDPAIAARAKTMRLHGIDRDVFSRFTEIQASWIYDVVAPGFKYNLTDIAAALGMVQLRRADEFQAARAAIAHRYDQALGSLPLVLPPRPATGDIHSWHLYIVQIAAEARISRNEFIAAMQAAGIGCSVHYRPLHKMSVWSPFCSGQRFPAADRYFECCVSLPLFMDMTEDEQTRVVDAVNKILRA